LLLMVLWLKYLILLSQTILDDTANIHPDQGPNNCDGPQG
jgi:hypothetical protein